MSNPIKRPNSNTRSLSRFYAGRSRMVHESCRITELPMRDGTVRRVTVLTGGTYRKPAGVITAEFLAR